MVRVEGKEARTVRQPFGATLIGGDDWNWLVQTGQPAGYTFTYFFRGLTSEQTLNMSGIIGADGTVALSATAAQTTKLVGSIAWQTCLFDTAGSRMELARGSVDVLPDIASAESVDGRSWAKRMLDAVTAAIEGRASQTEKRYRLGTSSGEREIEFLSPDDLLAWKGNLQTLYEKELVESGQKRPGGNQLRVSFGSSAARYGEWK